MKRFLSFPNLLRNEMSGNYWKAAPAERILQSKFELRNFFASKVRLALGTEESGKVDSYLVHIRRGNGQKIHQRLSSAISAWST